MNIKRLLCSHSWIQISKEEFLRKANYHEIYFYAPAVNFDYYQCEKCKKLKPVKAGTIMYQDIS